MINYLHRKSLIALFVAVFCMTQSPSLMAQGDSDIQASLKGKWKSVCMNLGTTFITITSVYDGAGHSNDRVVYYSNPSCSTPTGLVKTNSSVTYTLGNKITAGNGMAVYPINATINAWQLTQNGRPVQSGGAVPTQFDIISIKDNKLYNSGLASGRTTPITSPANRPTHLDMGNYFVRQ